MDYISNLSGFLIYSLKYNLPIDTAFMILKYIKIELEQAKLPYGMTLTRLFKHASVNFTGERLRRPSRLGFSLYSLHQAGILYNSSTRL